MFLKLFQGKEALIEKHDVLVHPFNILEIIRKKHNHREDNLLLKELLEIGSSMVEQYSKVSIYQKYCKDKLDREIYGYWQLNCSSQKSENQKTHSEND